MFKSAIPARRDWRLIGIPDGLYQAIIAIRLNPPMNMDWRAIMVGQRGLRLAGLCFLGIITAGCCPPSTIYVETTIYPDGSSDRMIWQPKDKFLPDRALKTEWNARWKTVSDASGRPGVSNSRASNDQCKYFIARGSFNSPREIPPHYHYADEEVPDAGASELERTYERKDFGFVVEHRWKEKITNEDGSQTRSGDASLRQGPRKSSLPPVAACSAGRGPAIKDVDIQFRLDDRDRGRGGTRAPPRDRSLMGSSHRWRSANPARGPCIASSRSWSSA